MQHIAEVTETGLNVIESSGFFFLSVEIVFNITLIIISTNVESSFVITFDMPILTGTERSSTTASLPTVGKNDAPELQNFFGILFRH